MGNRKENLKKSLGITEYPWSSDDEEDVQPTQSVIPRSNEPPRPSVVDLPGTSGAQLESEQSSPTTARRIQAKRDRDLFWSIINNTQKPQSSQPPRSRVTEPISSSTRSTSTQVPRPRLDLRLPDPRITRRSSHCPPAHSNSVDVQRVIAFKKLTRSLQNLAHIRAASNNSSPHPSASTHTSPRASRSTECFERPSRTAGIAATTRTIFSPVFSLNRDGYNYRPTWRRSLPIPPTYNNTNVSSLDDVTVDEPRRPAAQPWHYPHNDPPQPSTSANLDIAGTSQMTQPYVNVDNSDDDLQSVPPVVQKTEPGDETNENVEEENNEESVHNDTGSGARLIEEVVEVNVEGADETDNNPPPPGTEPDDEVSPTAESNACAGTAHSEENAETPQAGSSYHGVKRKRDYVTVGSDRRAAAFSDDSSEPYSVHEFNQSLLRLLECPVCLEWMEPPISQCRRGHLVCGRCRARLAACPVCRTPFSSVRNRAMEGVAEMLRYPCRHGCGREVRLRRRAPHEASCGARRYHCPAPPCARHPPLQHDELAHHFQCKHLPILKIGPKHKFSMKVNSEQHDTWLIMALNEYFHLRVDVDIRSWGVIVYVAYIGPRRNAKRYTYEVTVEGQHNSRRLVYARSTHSDLESSSLNVSRQDCFHLTLDQALNFLRFKNRHCEPDKFLDFEIEITKWDSVDSESKDDSES